MMKPLDAALRRDAGLSGDALVAQLWIDKDAALNWARRTDSTPIMPEARQGLLRSLRRGEAALQAEHPDWMTSAKPGVDAWVGVDGVWLTLVYEPRDGRRWRVTNTLAPRRGRPQHLRGDVPVQTRRGLDPQLLRTLRGLCGTQLLDRVTLSEHSLDRLRERSESGRPSLRQLERAIVSDGRVMHPGPGWADSSGRGDAFLICTWVDGDTLALPLQPDIRDDRRRVSAATCIIESWARRDLPFKGPSLSRTVLYSQRIVKPMATTRGITPKEMIRRLQAAVLAEGVSGFDPSDRLLSRLPSDAKTRRGPYIETSEFYMVLRPANPQQRDAGRGWMVTEIHTLSPDAP